MSSTQRLAAFPDIPTIAEQGFPDFSAYVYLGLVAPAGTPDAAVSRLAEALRRATSSAEIRERFRAEGTEPMSAIPAEFTAFLEQDSASMARLAAALGLKKQ